MTHLTPDELVDALDGGLEPSRTTHLDACERCRQQLADLGAVLRETRQVDVPEPSPLYWQHLSARVRTAIDAESAPAAGWRLWVRWPVLAPIAALTLIVMALTVAVPRQAVVSPDMAAVNEAAHEPLDDRFALVADLVGDLDWDTAMSAGLAIGPGAADQAMLELTSAEQQELTRLLTAELTKAKS